MGEMTQTINSTTMTASKRILHQDVFFNLPMNIICREMKRSVLKTYYHHYLINTVIIYIARKLRTDNLTRKIIRGEMTSTTRRTTMPNACC